MYDATKGTLIAMTAAGLFACSSGGGTSAPSEPGSRPSASTASAKLVKCAGINECKGQGACGGQGHDCAGKNACKGQGWVKTASAEACEAQGGEVI
jgi:hypothetical protein